MRELRTTHLGTLMGAKDLGKDLPCIDLNVE